MLTRREMLKLGLLGGGTALLATDRFTRAVAASNKLAGGGNDLFVSPPTRPFIKELPCPLPPGPVAPFMPGDPECRAFVDRAHFFELVEEARFVRVHPDLRPTLIWGFRDINVPQPDPDTAFVVGPTFKSTLGEPVIVRMNNRLPRNHVGFGMPRTSTHLHGGHAPFRSDGFPGPIDNALGGFFNPVVDPGGSYDYCYPLQDPGFSHNRPDRQERGSTLWYHDHFLAFTGPNVYRGLAGFFLVFDELDTGEETTGLGLPGRNSALGCNFDIPLVIQDKSFAADGSLVFDTFNHRGFLGDKFLVNGAIQPFFKVKRRKYRFRFLNGSNARFYQFFLSRANGKTFTFDQIATEGGLLHRPIRGIESFEITPAQRVEIVVDFSQFNEGDELFFENRLEQVDGRLPKELGIRVPILKLIVEEAVPDPSQVPEVLRQLDPIREEVLARATRRRFEFNRRFGEWAINGLLAGDLSSPIARVREDTPEIWHLVNEAGGWAHPIHPHNEFMRVLRRNGKVPPLNERDGNARIDTVNLGPNDEVEVFVTFRDFKGPFVFHCHNIEHEDMDMMARFDVV
jgi:FtsP/CotA-like multicopper oxidase with cupredoxin domain